MFAKGFAALALVAVVGAVVGPAACSTSGQPQTAPDLPVPVDSPQSIAQAKTGFQKTVRNDPNDRYAWYNLAVIAQGEKDLKTAAADYERAIAIQPDFESALYNLGLMRLQARNYRAAVTLLSRAASANAKDANALFQLAVALANLHTEAADAKSLVELRAAAKIDPKLLQGLPSGLFGTTSTTRGR